MTLLLFNLLLRLGFSVKLARPLAYVVAFLGLIALAVALWAAVGMWLDDMKDDAIQGDRAASKIEALQADRTATRAADAADAKAAEKARAEAESIEKDIANATASHPEQARAPAGPATSAVTDRLRNRAR